MLKLACLLVAVMFTACACSPVQGNSGAAQTVPVAATSIVKPVVRDAIIAGVHRLDPGARVQAITPMPIAGLYQVIAKGQVLYMTADGRYAIQGDAFDLRNRIALNGATMNRLRREAIAKLEPAQMIRFAPPNPKYTVTVFTDIDCPYCRAFHANMAAMNKLGIAVDYLFWPRTGLGTPSAAKAVDVWCASDRHAALTRAFEGTPPGDARCESPVTHDFTLGEDLGVDGTPTVVADNGVVLGGYVDPQELLRRLEQVHAPGRGGQGSASRAAAVPLVQ